MRKVLEWFRRLFSPPEAVPPPINRKERRTREAVARKQGGRYKAKRPEGTEVEQ